MDIIKQDLGQDLIMNYKGQKVAIKLFAMQDGQVKIGIDAPMGISINREEIIQQQVKLGTHNSKINSA